MSDSLNQVLEKIQNDRTITQSVPSKKLLNEVADAYALYGFDETMRRLEKALNSLQRKRNQILAAINIVQCVDEWTYVQAHPHVGRLIIKTLHLL